MKILLLSIFILSLSGIYLFSYQKRVQSHPSTQKLNNKNEEEKKEEEDYKIYTEWKKKFGKLPKEDNFLVFQNNLRIIEKHNNNPQNSYKLGLTKFADLTNEEYQNKYLQKSENNQQATNFYYENKPVNYYNKQSQPDYSINWAEKGGVTPVQDQGRCISSWAFSAVAALETAYFVNTGILKNLSAQQVLACTPSPAEGCDGGDPFNAYQYTTIHGIEPEETYPYSQYDNPYTKACYQDVSKAIWRNTGSQKIQENNTENILQQLQIQTLSTQINASSIEFQLYSGGIFDNLFCPSETNHTVTIIGYQQENNYWTIKNSWGTGWGDQGYIYIVNNEGPGICGINTSVTYPKFRYDK